MHVLFVHSDLVGGGVERVLVTIARQLSGMRRTICYCPANHPEPPGEFLRELRGQGIEAVRIRPPLLSPLYPLRLARVIRRLRPDVVHLHGTTLGVVGGLLRPLLPRPPVFIYTQHTCIRQHDKPWLQRAARMTFHRLDGIACVSRAVREELISLVPRAGGGNVRVIYNGIELGPFLEPLGDERRRALRREMGERAGWPVIVSVGLLRRVKGYHVLLEALRRVAADGVGAALAIAGEGEERERLEELAREMGIAERVRFLGWRGDVADILRAADIYVQPSLTEGMPMSVMEAAAAGLAIVATDVGGTGEIVEDGRSGLLVPPGDAGALAEALATVLRDAELRAQLGEAARRRAREMFDAAEMARAYAEFYRRTLDRAR